VKISVKNQRKIAAFIYTLGILLFFYFRLKNHQYFQNYTDNGYEIEVARAIVDKGKRPLVGPNLTAKDFFIPPTYPYIMAVFYKITGGNIFGINYCFILLNLVGITSLSLFFYKKTKNLILSSLLFLTISNMEAMILEATVIWHPHPTTAFTFLSLLLLQTAIEKNKFHIFFFGIFSYFIEKQKNKKKSIIIILFLSFLAAAIVYLPQIIFEFKNGFPTILSILNKQTLSIGEDKNLKESILGTYLSIKEKLFVNDFTFISIIIFILFNNFYFKKITMINLISIIFTLIISILFIPGKSWPYRLSFVTLAVVFSIFEILSKSIKTKKIIISIISLLFIYLSFKGNWDINSYIVKNISYTDSWKNIILISEKIDQLIIENNLNREETFIYTPSGELAKDKNEWKNKWKWFTNTYNTLINIKYNKEPQLSKNLRIFLVNNKTMLYPGNFILVCQDKHTDCYENFVLTIKDYNPQKKYSSLELKKEYETNLDDKAFTKIYLFKAE
jgi:hypothetical protein